MPERPWFRVRDNGLGWTPITWEGWFVVIGGAVIVVAINFAVIARLGVHVAGLRR